MGWIKIRADLDSCLREQDGMLKLMADLSTRLHACEKELKRLKDIQVLFDEKLEGACLPDRLLTLPIKGAKK